MKWFWWILVLLLIAMAAAFGWHWIAVDPGQVLIQVRGWRIETSVVVLIAGLILAWIIAAAIWKLLRWPFRAVPRQRQRLGQKRLAAALEAQFAGYPDRAERKLLRATRFLPLSSSAHLLYADSARRRGNWAKAIEHLDKADDKAPAAARVLRARVLRESGDAEQAAQLLSNEADAGTLTPAGWHELVLAELARGNGLGALDALRLLRKTDLLDNEAMVALEKKTLVEALGDTNDPKLLGRIWRDMPRTRRADPEILGLYVRHAARNGGELAAVGAVRSSLRKSWDPKVAAMYLGLDADPPAKRLKRAGKWLKKHPDDAMLLAAMGVLCAREGMARDARDYLERAVALDSRLAPAWAALGDVARDDGDEALASHCYRNAIGAASGDTPSLRLPGTQALIEADDDNEDATAMAASDDAGLSADDFVAEPDAEAEAGGDDDADDGESQSAQAERTD